MKILQLQLEYNYNYNLIKSDSLKKKILIKRKQSRLMSEQSLILKFCFHKCRHMGGRP